MPTKQRTSAKPAATKTLREALGHPEVKIRLNDLAAGSLSKKPKKTPLTPPNFSGTVLNGKQTGYGTNRHGTIAKSKHDESGCPPILSIQKLMKPVIVDGVLLLRQCEPSQDWLGRFKRHEVDQAYFEIDGRPIADVFAEAEKARALIKRIRSIPNPVVVGPVTRENYAFIDSHVASRIRTSNLDFQHYCQDISEDRGGAVESASGRANDGPARG